MADEPRNVRTSADSPANFGLHRRGQGRDAVSVTRFCRERWAIAECGPGMEPNKRPGKHRDRTRSVYDLLAFRVPFQTYEHYVLAFVAAGTRGVRLDPPLNFEALRASASRSRLVK